MPAEIGGLRKLTKLNLSHNKIHTLPVEFYRLTELQALLLSHNCLESITKDIGDLVMLQQMVISTILVLSRCLQLFSVYKQLQASRTDIFLLGRY